VRLGVRIVSAAILVATIALSARAQDIEPVILAGGYANLNFRFNNVSVFPAPSAYVRQDGGTLHHSGLWFGVEWKPAAWFGIDNYIGVYALGNDVDLIAVVPSGKIAAPKLLGGRVMPYAVAGFGIGHYRERIAFLFSGRTYTSTSVAARYGFGTDIRITPNGGLRLEATRMALHFVGWSTSWNLSTGYVFPF